MIDRRDARRDRDESDGNAARFCHRLSCGGVCAHRSHLVLSDLIARNRGPFDQNACCGSDGMMLTYPHVGSCEAALSEMSQTEHDCSPSLRGRYDDFRTYTGTHSPLCGACKSQLKDAGPWDLSLAVDR